MTVVPAGGDRRTDQGMASMTRGRHGMKDGAMVDTGRRFGSWIGLAFLVLTLLHVARGSIAFFDPAAERDVHTRWQEVQTLKMGLDPNTLHHRVKKFLPLWEQGLWKDPEMSFPAHLALDKRSHAIGVYPTWTYVLGLPLHWPSDLRQALVWYFLLELACVAALYRAATSFWGIHWRTGAWSTLALSSTAAAVQTGNYALLSVAALAGTATALQARRPALAAVCFAFAMLKPTIAAPFAIALVFDRTGRAALALATGLLVALALAFASYTGSSVTESIVGALSHAEHFVTHVGGLPAAVDARTTEFDLAAQFASAALVLALAFAVVAIGARNDPSLAFAVLSAASVTWTYHRHYDFVVLYFLLGHLLVGVVRARSAGTLSVMMFLFVSTGLLLWLPASWVGGIEHVGVRIAWFDLVALAALAMALIESRKGLAAGRVACVGRVGSDASIR